MGARGNSGIILSQIVRGAVEALATLEPPQRELDAGSLCRALQAAGDAAYAAVSVPVEGTMLTVMRAMSHGAEQAAAADLAAALEAALAAGERALARTPEQLPRLREAGVVDAGGAGLVELVRGLLAGVRGEPAPRRPSCSSRQPRCPRRAARRRLALPLLHELPRRGRGDRPHVARGGARGVRRQHPGRRRAACLQGARAHRRPRRRAPGRHHGRGDRRRRGERHARADRRAAAAARARACLRCRLHLARRRQPRARRVARRACRRRPRSRR